MTTQEKLDYIKKHINVYPDFPKKGILFRDIFGALTDNKCCRYLKDLLLEHILKYHPDVEAIIGLESRGFLFNLMLATELGVSCIAIRKKHKLPGECLSVEYELEYGKDAFELQTTAIKCNQKVLIIDDLLATGGSLAAAVKLVQMAQGQVLSAIVIMELTSLQGRERLKDVNVHSLLQY